MKFKNILVIIFMLVSYATAQHYFYKGYDYGSQAMYNPLSLMVNGGFDIMQLGNRRNLSEIDLSGGVKNVLNNLADPFSVIKRYGWKNFINQEVFPASLDPENMQYLPNYQLHLIGGGMTYAALEEWYKANNFPVPGLLGALTFLTSGFINEAAENGSYQGDNVDCLSDIYIFDLGGILLFSSENVRRFFSETLNMADWSLQPTYLFSENELHNTGQFFSIKWKFPFSEKWHLFYCFGTSGVAGLAYKFDDGRALSVGVGAQAADLVVLDEATNKKTVNLNGNVGIYYDKNNSLLASMVINFKTDLMKYRPYNIINYLVNLNIYPGLFKIGTLSPGLWGAIQHDGNVILGITANWFPIGVAHSIR